MSAIDSSELLLKCPFTCALVGQTSSGKTSFMISLLRNWHKITDGGRFDRILWCYGAPKSSQQETFDQVLSLLDDNQRIEFHAGLPLDLLTDESTFDNSQRSILIIDDLRGLSSSKCSSFSQIFTAISHHCNVCVFLILQELFLQSQGVREALHNCHLLFIFQSPRANLQLQTLSRQLFGDSKFLPSVYKQSVLQAPYRYFMVNTSPSLRNEALKVRSKVLREDGAFSEVFLPTKS